MTRGSVRAYGLTALEAVVAIGVASLAVAGLETFAEPVGLGVVYLLAVVFIAVRRGEVPALATAVLSVLVFNFLFIEPRYRLAIAHSEDVIALAVFLIVASVVSRLAAAAHAEPPRRRIGRVRPNATIASHSCSLTPRRRCSGAPRWSESLRVSRAASALRSLAPVCACRSRPCRRREVASCQ